MPFLRQTVVVLAGLWGLLGSFTAAQEFDTVAFMVFEPNGSPGACGVGVVSTDSAVAIPSAQFDGGSSCQRVVTLTCDGISASAMVVDECTGCDADTIVLTQGLFDKFAGTSLVGSWSFD